jgi:hypothetical protein
MATAVFLGTRKRNDYYIAPVTGRDEDGTPLVDYGEHRHRVDDSRYNEKSWEFWRVEVDHVVKSDPGWYALVECTELDGSKSLLRLPVLSWCLPSGAFIMDLMDADLGQSPILRVVHNGIFHVDYSGPAVGNLRLVGYHHENYLKETNSNEG